MSAQSGRDRLGDVAPGDLIELPHPDASDSETRQFKVVHKDSREEPDGTVVIVTLEGDNGETRDVELPADTIVVRTLESKWESPQSPTPHDGT